MFSSFNMKNLHAMSMNTHSYGEKLNHANKTRKITETLLVRAADEISETLPSAIEDMKGILKY